MAKIPTSAGTSATRRQITGIQADCSRLTIADHQKSKYETTQTPGRAKRSETSGSRHNYTRTAVATSKTDMGICHFLVAKYRAGTLHFTGTGKCRKAILGSKAVQATGAWCTITITIDGTFPTISTLVLAAKMPFGLKLSTAQRFRFLTVTDDGHSCRGYRNSPLKHSERRHNELHGTMPHLRFTIKAKRLRS